MFVLVFEEYTCCTRHASCIHGVMEEQRKCMPRRCHFYSSGRSQQSMARKGSPELYFFAGLPDVENARRWRECITSMHRPPYAHSSQGSTGILRTPAPYASEQRTIELHLGDDGYTNLPSGNRRGKRCRNPLKTRWKYGTVKKRPVQSSREGGQRERRNGNVS
jgi:hypothetical protein